jgi:RimJ/RimL family protein N-acetyltransferase
MPGGMAARFACEAPRSGAAALFALSLCEQLPTLTTDRLILRAPRVTDFDAFAGIACTTRGRFLGGPMNREDAWLDFAQMTSTWLLHGHGLWTIGHAGGIAGFVVLGFEPGDLEPELGFMLTKTVEGRGIAQEAAGTALEYAFHTLGWVTVVSYIDPANARAERLAAWLGALAEDTVDGARVWRYHREGWQ